MPSDFSGLRDDPATARALDRAGRNAAALGLLVAAGGFAMIGLVLLGAAVLGGGTGVAVGGFVALGITLVLLGFGALLLSTG